MAKERVEWIDVLRGFLMFFVIWGHDSITPEIDQYIYSFHMPAYFIISGMVSTFSKETRLLPFIKKKAIGLLIPYVVLNLYVIPLWYLSTVIGMNEPHTIPEVLLGILLSNRLSGYPMPSNTTWFITCLFLTELLFFVVKKLTRQDRFLVPALIAIWVIFYFTVGSVHAGGGLWHIESAFTAVLFYLAGYLFMKHYKKIHELLSGHPFRNTWILIVLFLLGFTACFFNGRVSMIGDIYCNVPLFFISALSTAFAVTLCFMLASTRPRFSRSMHIFDRIGKATLPYIAFQTVLIKLMLYYIPLFHIRTEPMRLLLSAILFFAFLPAAEGILHLIPLHGKRKRKS